MSIVSVSRIQIIDGTPPALPGKCAVCGTTAGPFIDFGLSLEFYGVVYLCIDTCLVEIAQSFGYHGPKQWSMVQNEISYQRQQINDLMDRNEALQSALAAMGVIINPVSKSIDSRHSRYEESKKDTGDAEQLVLDFDLGSSERKERNIESTHERRSSDIRRDDSDDDGIGDFISSLSI
jgi:hypothetical protein